MREAVPATLPRARRLGLLTIGQSPRPDLSSILLEALPADVEVVHAGVLDGLSRLEIAAAYPLQAGVVPLITRLTDGGVVSLGALAISAGLQRTVDLLEARSVDAIVVLCTGEFPALRTQQALLIESDHVVATVVSGIVRRSSLGVIVPLPDQVQTAKMKWGLHLSTAPVLACASPYEEEPRSLVLAARHLANCGAHALVLDCMGYSPEHKRALRSAGVHLPIFVSASVAAAAVASML